MLVAIVGDLESAGQRPIPGGGRKDLIQEMVHGFIRGHIDLAWSSRFWEVYCNSPLSGPRH